MHARTQMVLMGLAICGVILIAADAKHHTPPVLHSGDVPIGSLGSPLGTRLEITGVAADGFKIETGTLRIDSVDGRMLDPPVDLWIENIDLPKGRIIIRGYETGRMIGVPPAVVAEAEAAGKEVAVPQWPWQFRLHFVVTSAVEPSDLKIKSRRRE